MAASHTTIHIDPGDKPTINAAAASLKVGAGHDTPRLLFRSLADMQAWLDDAVVAVDEARGQWPTLTGSPKDG